MDTPIWTSVIGHADIRNELRHLQGDDVQTQFRDMNCPDRSAYTAGRIRRRLLASGRIRLIQRHPQL